MARTRGERRAAEDAARSKIAGMVTYIGDVGEAAATRSTARAGVERARARAHQLLEDARQEGERLVSEAQQRVTDADGRYAEAFNRAVDEGWAVRLLTDLGYAVPDRRIARQRSRVTDRGTVAVGSQSPSESAA